MPADAPRSGGGVDGHASSVRRLKKKSVLVAELGADGMHRFREGPVRELAIELRAWAAEGAPESYDAAMAAEAFEHFDRALPRSRYEACRWRVLLETSELTRRMTARRSFSGSEITSWNFFQKRLASGSSGSA